MTNTNQHRGKALIAAKRAKKPAALANTKASQAASQDTGKLLAIDPAEKTGWAVSSKTYGTWIFKLKRDENFGVKLLQFRSKLIEAVNKFKPQAIIYERVSGRFSGAIASHARFVGVIELYCAENNLPLKGYSATEIKKFATGKGNAKKPEMIAAAKKQLGYPGADDNEADALWLLHLAKRDLNIE